MHPIPRFFHHRPRLAIAILVGAIAWMVLPASWARETQGLTAWNIGVWSYLVSVIWLVTRATPGKVRAIAEWDPLESTCRHASLSIL